MTPHNGMGSHQSAKMGKDEWLTPPWILKALGSFDLDPCSPENPPWIIAPVWYSKKVDGLSKPWFGRVYCNPPYGSETDRWLRRCAEHGNAIALVFARTETDTFFTCVWGKADGILFIEGRLFFHHVNGDLAEANSGAPSVLIAYGKENARILEKCGIPGAYVGSHEVKSPDQSLDRFTMEMER